MELSGKGLSVLLLNSKALVFKPQTHALLVGLSELRKIENHR